MLQRDLLQTGNVFMKLKHDCRSSLIVKISIETCVLEQQMHTLVDILTCSEVACQGLTGLELSVFIPDSTILIYVHVSVESVINTGTSTSCDICFDVRQVMGGRPQCSIITLDIST